MKQRGDTFTYHRSHTFCSKDELCTRWCFWLGSSVKVLFFKLQVLLKFLGMIPKTAMVVLFKLLETKDVAQLIELPNKGVAV